MMQLRVVCEHDDGDAVLAVLTPRPGVGHLTRVPSVAAAFPGDVIEAVVVREAIEAVMEELVGLGVDQRGEISLQPIDVVVSKSMAAMEKSVPRTGAEAIIWDELIETTGEDSELTAAFLGFLTIGCLLAAIGVLTNSAVLIVGAMVVSPDFGPLAALGVAIAGRRRDLAISAGKALGIGFPVAILVTVLFVILARITGLLGPNPLTDLGEVAFVYQVGPYSVIVSLLAGAAGMLALTSQKSGALVGVFISITTVPAAGFAALAGVTGEWQRCGEALLQLFINLAGVVAASAVTLWFRRRHISTRAHSQASHHSARPAGAS